MVLEPRQLPSLHLLRHHLPGPDCGDQDCDRHLEPGHSDQTESQTRPLRRCDFFVTGLEPRLPATRTWQEARAADCGRGLAARDHLRLSRDAVAWTDPFGRLPMRQQISNEAAERPDRRVRVPALLLQQPFSGHQVDLHRALRVAWNPLDAIEPSQHLDLAPLQRCETGRVRRAEAVMRAEGLEPPSSCEHRHLKPACLPISPRPPARAV